VQTGHEKTMTALMAALAGANLIYGAGMTESGVTFDYTQYVLDNEIAAMVKRAVGGIPVNDEDLGVDDIHKVGSFGHYLGLPSTRKRGRELSQPQLLDRRGREGWEADGSVDAYSAAKAEAKRILAEYHPPELPSDVAAEVQAILHEVEKERGVV
jgi:trimethylamine--corrinoid protein Co-methyltransferase